MDIIVSLLVAVHVIVCLLLVVIVLMQRPKQEGLGAAFGGGMTDQMFGAQTTDVLQKGTVWLAVMFFVITMVLAILVSKQNSVATGLSESLGTSDPAAAAESGLPELPKGEATLTAPVPVPAPGAAGDAKKTAPEGGDANAKSEAKADAKGKAKAKAGKKDQPKPEKAEAKPAGEEKSAGEGASN